MRRIRIVKNATHHRTYRPVQVLLVSMISLEWHPSLCPSYERGTIKKKIIKLKTHFQYDVVVVIIIFFFFLIRTTRQRAPFRETKFWFTTIFINYNFRKSLRHILNPGARNCWIRLLYSCTHKIAVDFRLIISLCFLLLFSKEKRWNVRFKAENI